MQSYEMEELQVQDFDCLTVQRSNIRQAPLAIVLHGLGSAKENVLPSLLGFAKAGFKAVAFDARLHGSRKYASEREDLLSRDYLGTMYEMIVGTSGDVSALLNFYNSDSATVHGISLGGFIAFTSMLDENRLGVASIAMGSPDWFGSLEAIGLNISSDQLSLLARNNPLDRGILLYPPRPLLMLHGSLDDVVPISGVRRLTERLRSAYADIPDRLELVEYPEVGHTYIPDMLNRSILWAVRHNG